MDHSSRSSSPTSSPRSSTAAASAPSWTSTGGGSAATTSPRSPVPARSSRARCCSTPRAAVRDAGAQLLRGGAYKPRTSPYSFQGLGEDGLRLLAEAKAETGLPIVTELMDVRDLDAVLEVADVIQLGARNMQNYTLLTELGRAGRPVLLKRGLSATLEELLMAAEYVLKEGNPNVMLCERGIRTYEPSYRFTLDLMAVPVLRELTHLPIVVDPSHAARQARAGGAALAGRGRRRRGRHDRRGAPVPRGGRLRRPQALLLRHVRRLPAQAGGGGRAGGQDAGGGGACEDRRPRRGADRRLDRPGRAGARRGRGGGGLRAAAPSRLALRARAAARSTGPPGRVGEALDGAELCFACAPVGALPEQVRAALAARRTGLRR